jgi:hypothetical protein
MSESRFGYAAVGDKKLVPRLRKGFGVTLRSIERAEQFMDAWQPLREEDQPSDPATCQRAA